MKNAEQKLTFLNEVSKSASLGELGGFRPLDKDDRFHSWWGGNFLGQPNERVPICKSSARTMAPILQVRVDELPHIPTALSDIALLSLWRDLETDDLWEAKSGVAFEIRTYASLEGLVPLGPGYREQPEIPTFPIRWTLIEGDLPCWEDLPDEVMIASESDWYFDLPVHDRLQELQSSRPIKMGGYPQWWQSPQEVDGGEFAFFLDTTERGQFGFPAGGSGNFFRSASTWVARVDCP